MSLHRAIWRCFMVLYCRCIERFSGVLWSYIFNNLHDGGFNFQICGSSLFPKNESSHPCSRRGGFIHSGYCLSLTRWGRAIVDPNYNPYCWSSCRLWYSNVARPGILVKMSPNWSRVSIDHNVCVRHYDFLDEDTLEQFFVNLQDVFCIMPGNQQAPNTVSWNAHFFDDMVYELLSRAKPKFERFLASNQQQLQLGTWANAVLVEAGQACACINQSM
jgi:hypothetical protein